MTYFHRIMLMNFLVVAEHVYLQCITIMSLWNITLLTSFLNFFKFYMDLPNTFVKIVLLPLFFMELWVILCNFSLILLKLLSIYTCADRAVWDPAVAASSVVAVSVGDSSEITLSVIAYPQPTFTWRRISVRGEEDLSAQVSNKGLTSTLGLTNVTEEDLSYRFVCDVANDVGTTRFNFTLIRQSAGM